mgnify:FL=1
MSFIWDNPETQIFAEQNSKDIGFIAQEIAVVLPEMVFKRNVPNAYFQVKYAEMISICLEAVKEQSLIIEDREKRLELLEEKAKEKGLI